MSNCATIQNFKLKALIINMFLELIFELRWRLRSPGLARVPDTETAT